MFFVIPGTVIFWAFPLCNTFNQKIAKIAKIAEITNPDILCDLCGIHFRV